MKLGRIKKNSNKIGKHNKYRRDNIIRRFKVSLMNNIYECVNKSFIINNNSNNNKNLNMLKRISSYNVKLMSKRDTINLVLSSLILYLTFFLLLNHFFLFHNKSKKLKKFIFIINFLQDSFNNIWLNSSVKYIFSNANW